MPVQESQISNVLRRELWLALQMHSCVVETYPDKLFIPDDRTNLFAAYVHLADDLYSGIPRLLDAGGGCDGGAFALVRPFIEACVMAQWLYFCASEENVRRAHAGEEIGCGLPNMMKALDQAAGAAFWEPLRTGVRALHSFTHGGIEQLARRFDAEGNLRASYKESEKIDVLRMVTRNLTVLSQLFLKTVLPEGEGEERSAVVQAKLVSLYGLGKGETV